MEEDPPVTIAQEIAEYQAELLAEPQHNDTVTLTICLHTEQHVHGDFIRPEQFLVSTVVVFYHMCHAG